MTPSITVPRIVKPNTGLTSTTHRGKPRFFARYWRDGKMVTSTLKAESIEQARIARDRLFDALVAAGGRRKNRTSRSALKTIERIRQTKDREAYIRVVVEVKGKHVGSFSTMEEAVEARDAYIHRAAAVKSRLLQIKQALR
jgi:hypothetical protein